MTRAESAALFAVTVRKERRETIAAMWQACHTQEEIAAAVGIDRVTVTEIIGELSKLEELPKSTKLAAQYQDDFVTAPPLGGLGAPAGESWVVPSLGGYMGHVKIGERDLADYSDGELRAWLEDQGTVKNRPRADTVTLWAAILRVFDEEGTPQTVRGVFYQLTTRGRVAKTEQGYRQAAYRTLQMRRMGLLPFSFIADSTRWMRKPSTYASAADALAHMQKHYRRALVGPQRAYVEVWIEKDALAGVVHGVTERYDVPLMVTKAAHHNNMTNFSSCALARCGSSSRHESQLVSS